MQKLGARAVPSTLLALLLVARGARAAEPAYSDLERDIIEQALSTEHRRLEPHPQGKPIEGIDVVRLEVFDERDPIPDFFNVFHVTSHESVIRRELLFAPGQVWEERLVSESARNLRSYRQLSLVLIVATKGKRPGSVRALVITKDVWSLRLNTDFQISNGELTSLVLQPAEINAFGTHAAVGALFVLRPATYSLGLSLSDRRIGGSHVASSLSGNLISNRDTGRTEGSFGTFYYGQPLWSVDTEWAWSTYVVWRTDVFRSYFGTRVRTYDADVTPGVDDAIPYVYGTDRQYGSIEVTRSFGRRFKHDASLGLEAYRQAFRPEDRADTPEFREFVRSAIPIHEKRISPYLQLETHTTEFLSVLDFNSLGLHEDYKLGHDVLLRVYPASTDFGSSRTLLGTYLAGSYTVPLGDGLTRVLLGSTREFSSPGESEGLAQAALRVVTPRLAPGRLVFDGVLFDHYQNYLNDKLTLGGDGRLRGYPIAAFLGDSVLAGSVEYRSRPLQILSAQVGGALFYDVGDAFDSFAELRPNHDVGLGLRMLFPQADKIVLRADWGFPIGSRQFSAFPGSLFVSFGQAFGMPAVTPPLVSTALVPVTTR